MKLSRKDINRLGELCGFADAEADMASTGSDDQVKMADRITEGVDLLRGILRELKGCPILVAFSTAEAEALSMGVDNSFGDAQDEAAVFGNRRTIRAAYAASEKLSKAIHEHGKL